MASAGILPLTYFENIADYVAGWRRAAGLVGTGIRQRREHLSHAAGQRAAGAADGRDRHAAVQAAGDRRGLGPSRHARSARRATPDNAQPTWGRWFRIIGANKIAGQTVMSATGTTRCWCWTSVGKGRVAELMSDQIWLWARGFEGGGPQAELLRRLAHWLMKEPELEAERLTASIVDGKIVITRRTMAPQAQPVIVTMPSGKTERVDADARLSRASGAATAKVDELGLYRVTDGTLSTVTAAGPLNPKEVADMRATDQILKPIAEATGGGVHWLADGLPEMRRVAPGETASGDDWIGLRSNGAYRVTALEQQPLLPPWLALLLVVGSLLLAWRMEGR